MSGDGQQAVGFDVIRQFTIVPDRRYRVESSGASLRFCKTGSQFDIQWLVRGARPFLGDRIADAFARSSRGKLIVGGIVVTGVSALVLLFAGAYMLAGDVPMRSSSLRGLGVLFFAFILGLVMIMAGVSSQQENAAAPRQNFDLPLMDIVDVKVLPVQSELARRGEPQVARLHLESRAGGTIKLAIPTDADLESIKSVIPQLAA